MLENASTLTLNQDDINTAVQYWLNKEILINECYVTNVDLYLHGDVDEARSFMVKFSPAGTTIAAIEET